MHSYNYIILFFKRRTNRLRDKHLNVFLFRHKEDVCFFLFFWLIQRAHIVVILSYVHLLCLFLRYSKIFNSFLVLTTIFLFVTFLSTLVASWNELKTSSIFVLKVFFLVMVYEILKFLDQQNHVFINFRIFFFLNIERGTFSSFCRIICP